MLLRSFGTTHSSIFTGRFYHQRPLISTKPWRLSLPYDLVKDPAKGGVVPPLDRLLSLFHRSFPKDCRRPIHQRGRFFGIGAFDVQVKLLPHTFSTRFRLFEINFLLRLTLFFFFFFFLFFLTFTWSVAGREFFHVPFLPDPPVQTLNARLTVASFYPPFGTSKYRSHSRL